MLSIAGQMGISAGLIRGRGRRLALGVRYIVT
jgi:hypothetical protein